MDTLIKITLLSFLLVGCGKRVAPHKVKRYVEPVKLFEKFTGCEGESKIDPEHGQQSILLVRGCGYRALLCKRLSTEGGGWYVSSIIKLESLKDRRYFKRSY